MGHLGMLPKKEALDRIEIDGVEYQFSADAESIFADTENSIIMNYESALADDDDEIAKMLPMTTVSHVKCDLNIELRSQR